ncbi:MAG TPA: TetR/AcrR family transcriptional regulator [Actinoplanes sp.]|nr:TetR/AcrR family transcriptional regulator [Actinoplanes sp.]
MTETRSRLLDAATDVLLRDGARSLTLDAVAKQAQVSKGGLLYHFPTKQALVAGMVDRLVGHFDAALAEAGDEPGAATRTYLTSTVEQRPTAAGAAADRATAALFAASIVEAAALAPLREIYRAWQRRLENDGIDPAVATAVRLAVDGWWLSRLVDLAPPENGLHERVYVLLTDLIDGKG